MNTFLTQRELLSILFKEKRLLCAVFLIPLVLIIAISFVVSPSYEASSKILVKSGREYQTRSDPGQQPAIVPYQTKQEIVNSELEILTSRDLALTVVRQIGLKNLYPSIRMDSLSEDQAMDNAVTAFKKNLKVDNAMMSNVISISFQHKDRTLAVQSLSALLAAYQEKHASLFNDRKSDFIKQTLDGYEQRLTDVTEKITTIRKSYSLFDVTAQRAQLIQDRAAVANSLRALQSREVDTEQLIAYYGDKLKTMKPLMVGGDREAESVDNAKTKLIELESQMTTMRQRYADDARPVLDLQEKINTVQTFIKGKSVSNRKEWKMRDPAYDDAVLKLQTAQAEAATLKSQIELQQKDYNDLEAQLSKLEDGTDQLEQLEREHASLDDLTRTTRTSYEQARTNEELDKQRIVSVNIFEQPSASTAAVKPKRVMFILAGLVAGLVCMSAVVLYLLTFRKTLITAESVERILHMKVISTVPNRMDLAA